MLESRESDTLPRELPDEAAWVDLLQAGDDGAYERLVRTFGGRMLAVARRYVRNEEDARDVVQNAFCSAFKAIGTFRQDARLGTWLHRIVVNAALMHIRARHRLAEEPIADLLPHFHEDGSHAGATTAWSTSADEFIESLERREARKLLRQSVAQLPASYRTVFLLRDIEERSTEETAELLGITQNAVKIRLHRSHQALVTLHRHRLIGTDLNLSRIEPLEAELATLRRLFLQALDVRSLEHI